MATLAVNGAFHGAQRFAIDFVRLNADGRLFTGAKDEIPSYAYYAAEVRAAAGGVVIDVLNDLPDNVPGKFPDHPTPHAAMASSSPCFKASSAKCHKQTSHHRTVKGLPPFRRPAIRRLDEPNMLPTQAST